MLRHQQLEQDTLAQHARELELRLESAQQQLQAVERELKAAQVCLLHLTHMQAHPIAPMHVCPLRTVQLWLLAPAHDTLFLLSMSALLVVCAIQMAARLAEEEQESSGMNRLLSSARRKVSAAEVLLQGHKARRRILTCLGRYLWSGPRLAQAARVLVLHASRWRPQDDVIAQQEAELAQLRDKLCQVSPNQSLAAWLRGYLLLCLKFA